MSETKARCSFYIRTQVAGGFRYDPVDVKSRGGVSYLTTSHPPMTGDLISLPDGQYTIVARSWTHSQYGSVDWPHSDSEPRNGPLLTLIVEPAIGPFIDEIYVPEGDEEPAEVVSRE